ncbi:hypothetical protein AVEN_66904-1 [Araneus ventricosus]|uniref:Uncharacterized protein n=1 Tax=Araneus ventricosus TaxID=182803 RepID=A0A4Y2SRW5_ARAVE|nr:hypothetical protein AVEN_66904-1 [Araneus ventricosus]
MTRKKKSQLALFRAFSEGFPPAGPEPWTRCRHDGNRRTLAPVPYIRIGGSPRGWGGYSTYQPSSSELSRLKIILLLASVLNGRAMEEMDFSDGFSEDEYSRLSIDETNHSDYNDEDLIRILSPETFCPADIQLSTAPLESKANYICSRIIYLDKLRIAAQSKLALYERLNNCGALTLRANLNDYLERNHVFWDLKHIVRKAQGELTRLSACPIPNCDKHSNKFHSPNTVLVKISPQPKTKPQKSRQRNSNEEFEIVQKNKIARKNSNDNIPNNIQTENRFNVLAETADPTNEQEVLKPQPVMLKITDNYNLLLQKINREFKEFTQTLLTDTFVYTPLTINPIKE